MKLVALKNASDDSCCIAMPREQYGYGLRIYLDDDQCEALGITKALRAGTQVTISAKAIVTSATESVESDGDDAGPDISLSLQITDMGLTVGSVLRNAADVLYGGAD
jgi:hypothetical protein